MMALFAGVQYVPSIGVGLLLFLSLAPSAIGQKKVSCPDGEHIEIDVRQISIRYDASSFAGTLGSLSALGARLEIAPKHLQEAAVATQQWDEFLKGLAAGYNSCAISRQQYAEGLTRIYPRIKEDGAGLEEMRKAIAAGQKIDAQRLQRLIDSFSDDLRQFAQLSGKEIILERIAAISEQLASSRSDILGQQRSDTARILAKLDELKQSNQQAPLPTPAQVGQQISEVRKSMNAKADEAESAYNKGYALLDQYRFAEAIPYLQQALSDVSVPAFYLALGRAYTDLPHLEDAERVLREGLKNTPYSEEDEAELKNQLGLVLLAKGDLEGALQFTKSALSIDENLHGPEQPTVAIKANNTAQILEAKGDLDGALQYMQRALSIDEKVQDTEYPTVARDANNIGAILRDKGDLDGALRYTKRALDLTKKVFGTNNPTMAIQANNMGAILEDRGDLDGALQYEQLALSIDEKVFGPEYPTVATDANNIGSFLKAKGDLDGALQYEQRALSIDEKVYGSEHPDVARDYNNIGSTLQAKGDLDGALRYTQRALNIDERIYGPEHPTAAIRANNIGSILKAKGDLDGALQYTQRAFNIDEKVFGPNNPRTKIVAANLEQIRRLMMPK
jgi:tetratricopeptide (TPR) repeat protein